MLLSPLLQARGVWARIRVVAPELCLCLGCHMPGHQSVLTGKASVRDQWGLDRGPGVWGWLAVTAVLSNPQRPGGGTQGPRTLSGRASPASRVSMPGMWGIPRRV